MPDWYNEVKRIYLFHQDKVKHNGKHKNLGRSGKDGWSISDTARAMGISKGKASEAIRLYKFSLREEGKCIKDLPEQRAALTLMKYREM